MRIYNLLLTLAGFVFFIFLHLDVARQDFRHLMRESGERVSKAGLFYVVDPDVAPVYCFF